MCDAAGWTWENARQNIRQRLWCRQADQAMSAERSRRNICACIDLIRRSPKKTLTVECFETLAHRWKREKEEAHERLNRCVELFHMQTAHREQLDIQLQLAIRDRNLEAQERIKAARLAVEQALRHSQADYERQMQNFRDAADEEVKWSKIWWSVGGGIGTKVPLVAVLGTGAAVVAWPVTVVVVGTVAGLAVGRAIGDAVTTDAEHRLEANPAYVNARGALAGVTERIAGGLFSPRERLD